MTKYKIIGNKALKILGIYLFNLIKFVHLKMFFSALPTFTEGAPRDVNASVGDSVTMSCNTLANPPATVTWLRNGEKINGMYWI